MVVRRTRKRFRPLRGFVVKRIEAEERITDDFIIPVTAKEKPQQDEVVAWVSPSGPLPIIREASKMFTEAVLSMVFVSHMSVAAAFPWLALQSIALRSLQTAPVEGPFNPALRVPNWERPVSAAEVGSDPDALIREPESRKAA